MAPTTTFSKSTKKGLAVLVALCMLAFYTGHLSNGGDGAQSAVSLLRNEKLDDVKNDIVDNTWVGLSSSTDDDPNGVRPCKIDYTACLSYFQGSCVRSCCGLSRHCGHCRRECKEKLLPERCNEYDKSRAPIVRDRPPDAAAPCPLWCGTCCHTPYLCSGLLCNSLFCNGDTVFPPDGNFDPTCHAKTLDGCEPFYNYEP